MTQRITPRYMHIAGAAIIALEQGTTDVPVNVEAVERKLTVVPYYWNPNTLAYEVARQVSTAGASTGGGGSTAVDANLTSVGSTKLVGQVTVANPTTSVSLSSQATVTVGNPTTSVSLSSQITASVTGTTSVNVANQPTVDLSSVGSTKVVGTVNNAASTSIIGAVSLATAGTTATLGQVALSSGSILGAGSSANTLGSVALIAGTTANSIGSVALVAGTSANTVGSVALVAGTSANLVGGVVINSGTTAITVGAVALLAGSSANLVGGVVINSGTTAITLGAAALLAGGSSIGSVQQGLGSSNNFWTADGFAFTSALTSRTSISTTVDTAVVAANANQKALVIANLSTSQTVALGLSTAAVTTALGNVSVYLQPAAQLTFGGLQGGLPNYTGAIRGINITSTTVGGGVAVTRFINT